MKERYVLLVVALSAALSGCPPRDSGGIITIEGDMRATDQGFRLDGEVVNNGYTAPTYHNVTVHLYTANGTLIKSVNVGSVTRSTDISIRSIQIPKYIIINSPEFWEHDNINVNYYELRDPEEYADHVVDEEDYPHGIYKERSISTRDEFPVAVPLLTVA